MLRGELTKIHELAGSFKNLDILSILDFLEYLKPKR